MKIRDVLAINLKYYRKKLNLTQEQIAELIDVEIKKLADEAARRAEEVLKANKAVLDKLAEELLAHETLEETELEPILKPAKLPEIVKLHK